MTRRRQNLRFRSHLKFWTNRETWLPIFRDRCLECHGADEAKGDFRIDDPESLADYVEAGDVESSGLYTDSLTTDDEDMLMPPKSEGGPLLPGELALIRVWIEEGANWPEGYSLSESSDEPESPVTDVPLTLDQRIWKAIGYLHPATIHLPIALFLLGALFVVVGVKFPSLGTQIPLACLLIGTASAIAATAMGWSLAPTMGYGEGWELLSFERDVDAHRWSGRSPMERPAGHDPCLRLFDHRFGGALERERPAENDLESWAACLRYHDRTCRPPRWRNDLRSRFLP